MEKTRDYHLDGDYHTPESICPYCGRHTDGAAGPEPPEPGAISICIQCYNLGIFDTDLKIRKPTVEEFGDIRTNPTVWKEIEMIRFLLKQTETMQWKKSNESS